MSTDAETRSPDVEGADATSAEAPLRKLGKYLIEKKLGQGGMGAVYLARDTELRRTVAIKVLPRDKASNPILVRRFKAEAQAAAQLRHDNIVAVYDSDEADGYLFIAMEYVEGNDLHEMISRRGTIPVKRSIEIIKHVAAALQHAHEHKIVHRDIKPSNLLIRRDGAVKLTDLGLARSVDDTIETGITRAGTTVGTVDYMAPEQARNSKLADIRSDIYSLGCTWFQMLTGHAPYPEGSLTNKLQAHAIKPIPDPRTENPNVTEGLVAVIQRMMAKKADDRYQSPAELLQDLEASSLTRAAFSQEIFNAIGDESGHAVEQARVVPLDDPDRPAGSRRPAKQRARGQEDVDDGPEASKDSGGSGKARKGPSSLPPPARRRPIEDEDVRPPSPWGERVKMILLLGGVVAGIGGLAWLVSGVGNAFGPAGMTVVPKGDPNAIVPVPEGTAPVVASVSGGATGPLVDTSTPVATVFSTPPPGGAAAAANQAAGRVNGTSTGGGVSSDAAGQGNQPARQFTSSSVGTIRPPDPQSKPAWPAAAAVDTKTAGFSVGAGAATDRHFSSLNDALLKLPAEGGVIKLQGSGPFTLSITTALKFRKLTILGDPKTQSLIVPVKAADGELGRLHVQGDLELSHVHLAVDQSANPAAKPTSLITVRGGSCSLMDCTLSVMGTGGEVSASGALITGLSLIGGAQPQRLACRRSAIRGELAAGISVESAAIDAVIDESLVVAGSGATIRFEGPSGAANPEETSRWVRVFASTLCSRDRLVDFAPERAVSEPAKTQLIFRDVVGCTASATGAGILLNVADWEQQRVRDHISWSAVDSTFVGFQHLIDLGQRSSFRADDAESWRQFWRQRVEDYEFVSEVWPTSLPELGLATPLAFDRNQLPTAARHVGARGELPGVSPDWLQLTDAIPPERLTALASRPTPPVLSGWVKVTGELARIDLRKQDLGQVLNKNEWPDGAVIEAVGYGVCTSSPVQIQGKKLKLIFRQAEGGPLRLMPKESFRSGGALFDVVDGGLELQGLRAQYPDPRPRHPAWLVQATNSIVRLNGCELRGPDRAAVPYRGLVQLTSPVTEKLSTAAVVISSSVLLGAGPLLHSEGGGRFFVRDSLLAANDRVVEIQLAAHGTRVPFTLDFVSSTVSSTGSVFRIAPASMEGPSTSPARLYVDQCAFLPPGPWKASGMDEPSLVTCQHPVLQQRQVTWWGRNNGIVKSLSTLLVAPDATPPQRIQSIPDWEAWWGRGHDLNLLTGGDGVVLAGSYASRSEQLEPEQFALHPSSKSMTWADGGPIGADVRRLSNVGPLPVETSTPAAGKSATTKPNPGGKTAPPKRPAF